MVMIRPIVPPKPKRETNDMSAHSFRPPRGASDEFTIMIRRTARAGKYLCAIRVRELSLDIPMPWSLTRVPMLFAADMGRNCSPLPAEAAYP
jgi:hypothetical protein